MQIVVGTSSGLVLVGLDGTCSVIDDRPVSTMSGPWVLRDGGIDGVPPLPAPSPARCVLDLGGGALIGTAGARLFLDGAPVETFDQIETRDEWYTPWGAPPDTRSLAASDEAGWLVNVHVGGVWRAPDGDRSPAWTEVVETDADTHQVVARGAQVAAAAAVGLGVSRDGGATWRWRDDGLHARYCRAVALSGDSVVLSASTGPRTTRAALYRGAIGGGPLERCTQGLPEWFASNVDTNQLAASRDGALVACGTDDGTLYASSDEGATWDLVRAGLPPIRCVAISE